MIYFFMICAMTIISLIGPIEDYSGNVEKDYRYMFRTLYVINLLSPMILYLMMYYYGMENYNNKRFLIGVIVGLYIVASIGQYIILREKANDKCSWKVSGKKYNTVKDTIYRLIYFIFMIMIPFYLNNSGQIVTWSIFAPVIIPTFLYITSKILGMGISGGKNIIDAGDYYNAFIRGINKGENYTDSGLGLNILRSITRTILLGCMFVVSFLVSKKIVNVNKTSPMSIFVFMIIVSSLLPLILGYLIEPKCLLEQAEGTKENESITCYVFDKHGGVYSNMIYLLICGLIIISKDN